MKILVLSRSTTTIGIVGGMETHLNTLAEYLVKNGCEVDVVTTAHPKGINTEVINGIRYIYLPRTKTGHYRGGWWGKCKEEVNKLINEKKYDIAWSQCIAALGSFKIFKEHNIPVAGICHGTVFDEFISNIRSEKNYFNKCIIGLNILKILIKNIFNILFWHNLQGIIAVSETLKNKMARQYFINPSKIRVIHHGVDINKFYPSEKVKNNVLLSIGRLSKEKGHHYGIEIANNLIKEGANIKLIIVGKGKQSYKNYLKKLINNKNLEEFIKLVGYVQKLKDIFDQTKVLLLPTLQNEAFGIVVIEAMACGIPVVAFNNGAVCELINNGENGFLINSKDIVNACLKINELLNDKGKYLKLSKNARTKAEKYFSLNRMGELSSDFFVDITNKIKLK